MDGLVSLLPEPFYGQVQELWEELGEGCEVRGIYATPVPHFSWHVAAHYDQERLQQSMAKVCAETSPFRIRTAGLGIFTGELPVIYISLVKDQRLLDFHARVWRLADESASDSRQYYSPEFWMPHITLVFQDVCTENIQCISEHILSRSFDWEMDVDNLSLIGQPEGKSGSVYFRLPFQGGR